MGLTWLEIVKIWIKRTVLKWRIRKQLRANKYWTLEDEIIYRAKMEEAEKNNKSFFEDWVEASHRSYTGWREMQNQINGTAINKDLEKIKPL